VVGDAARSQSQAMRWRNAVRWRLMETRLKRVMAAICTAFKSSANRRKMRRN